jgi:hypothetical protein
MENPTTRIPSITSALKMLSDGKTLTLFNSIAVSNGDKYISLREMNITTKQYYSRISGLINAGLIRRHKGKYCLTLLGKVVYDTQMTIGKALTYYWKLKAIESIEISSDTKLQEEEITQLIDALIDDHNIKDILMKPIYVPSSENKSIIKVVTPSMEQRITT